MQAISWQSLTVRLPAALIEAISHTAERRGLTVSEWVRSVVHAQLDLDPDTRRYATLMYEAVKTRAVLLRLLDTQLDKAQVDKLLALAEEDATDYVRERLRDDNGTV